MEQSFTLKSNDATIDLTDNLLEDEEMLSRYHFENVIYLYAVFEKQIAYNITQNNSAQMPLTLYETPKTAQKASQNQNIQNPITLRFAVHTPFEMYTYDELIEESKLLVKKSGLPLQSYMDKCRYVRKYDGKEKRIVYIINDPKLIINLQNI